VSRRCRSLSLLRFAAASSWREGDHMGEVGAAVGGEDVIDDVVGVVITPSPVWVMPWLFWRGGNFFRRSRRCC
jgi:hypothetical protein